MYKLKTGEVIDTNKKTAFIKKRVELNGKKDIETLILRTLISADKPLKLSELVKQSNIYKQKLQYNLRNMIKQGLVLKTVENDVIFYAPQVMFRDNKILYKIIEGITPIIKDINESIDYRQVENSNTLELLLNYLQSALKLFNFEIEELKKEV